MEKKFLLQWKTHETKDVLDIEYIGIFKIQMQKKVLFMKT